MKTRHFLLAIAAGLSSFGVCAEQDISLDLDSITIQVIYISMPGGPAGLGNSTIRKVCMDGQAYLLLTSPNGIVGLSASFKNGKPEQCTLLAPTNN
jgi:hypothetical protein